MSGYGGGKGYGRDRSIPQGGGAVMMIGMSTRRKCNRSRIVTGVRFMPTGGIYTRSRRRSL